MDQHTKKRLAIMASGRGSNAQKIMGYAQRPECSYEVALVISNRKSAGVLDLAQSYKVPAQYISNQDMKDETVLLDALSEHDIDGVVLAGYLRLIHHSLIDRYPKKIVNIHPALLPKYGGRGMYGHHVHEAVAAAGDTTSGITIHFVNEIYDEGQIIFQTKCQLAPSARPEEIAAEVLALEHEFYPRVLDGVFCR